MNYGATSISSLRELHEAIQRCVDEDNNTPPGVDKPYGVGEHSDWKKHLDQIESELKKEINLLLQLFCPRLFKLNQLHAQRYFTNVFEFVLQKRIICLQMR
jgi:hypothetical protein